MIVSVCPNPCLDVYYYTSVLKEDDTNRVENPFLSPGGKGLNAARVISRLGASPNLITVLGGCIGECVRKGLEKERVDFKAVGIKEETRVNTILEQKGKGSHVLIACKGPVLSDEEVRELKELICSYSPQFLILGGSVPPGLPDTFYKDIIEHFKMKGCEVLVDADGMLLKNAVKASPFAIKPNKHELERLVGRPLFDFNDIVKACKEVVSMGVSVVVSSLGRYGAVAVTADKVIRAVPPEVKVVNTVGAGDSVVGGFIFSLDKGWSLEESLAFAVACGTATVMKEGPKLCDVDTVYDIYERVMVSYV
ncbi:1-phosphofructokinase family hexose kinase [Desulfurobacterium atlanticum]|uniref:Fructose-1-phosphate kinase n=1 Tax=Desulfurobacterium atlanticum TaxID=240169 RepID=A0A238Y7Z2_9BACT|nr:1-phosphofructokinase family hexose kinase [Desulfurobacterium atlanticum]SNR67120.1 fructose-1-phosphate kinase [Desulfurobacterium atlanticum]